MSSAGRGAGSFSVVQSRCVRLVLGRAVKYMTRPAEPGQWVEQDSNLRRQCHQIYSLAPLATWVSTRVVSPRSRSAPEGPPRPTGLGTRSPGRLRAGGESRTHNRRFTKPVLCQLSYASVRRSIFARAVKFPNIPGTSQDASPFPHPPVVFRSCRRVPAEPDPPREIHRRTRPRPVRRENRLKERGRLNRSPHRAQRRRSYPTNGPRRKRLPPRICRDGDHLSDTTRRAGFAATSF